MSGLIVYGHPFSSYTQKALMAFYEKGVAFDFRVLAPDNPQAGAEWQALWPIGKFPVLVADGVTLPESSVIVEWLDHCFPGHHPGEAPLIPADPDLALEVRLLDRVFDNYVMTPMMKLVSDRMRPEGSKDPYGVEQAHAVLDRSLGWLEQRMASRGWAVGERFTLADCAAAPSLFYADWVHPLAAYPAVVAYLARLRQRPSFYRCVEDARPARALFPGGVPAHIT
jgi:glutathione S-transferase